MSQGFFCNIWTWVSLFHYQGTYCTQQKMKQSHTIHVWYIYLRTFTIKTTPNIHVGKYTSPMDVMVMYGIFTVYTTTVDFLKLFLLWWDPFKTDIYMVEFRASCVHFTQVVWYGGWDPTQLYGDYNEPILRIPISRSTIMKCGMSYGFWTLLSYVGLLNDYQTVVTKKGEQNFTEGSSGKMWWKWVGEIWLST